MSKQKPTYSIASFHIENFKGIKHIDIKNLPEAAPWIFLTGENGYGKTSVLQGIASTLTGLQNDLFQYFNKRSLLECKLHGINEPYKIETIDKYAIVDFYHRTNFEGIACYGSTRIDTYKESSEQTKLNPTESLYNTRTLLENIEYQITRWYAKKDDDKDFKEKYETTKKLLIDLLQIKDIEIDFKTDEVFYIEQDADGMAYEKLPLSQLASGYRSLVAMVGDMILKLFRTQPAIHNPSELEGIVIIDELDLHFHPKWQKRLPTIFTKYFPKIQFIASTHSPIPFLGAPTGSVFLTVNRSKEEGITVERAIHLEQQISKLTPNLLLDSFLFGHTDLHSTRFRSNRNIHTEDTFEEIQFNEQLEQTFLEELAPAKKEQLKKLLRKEN